MAHIHSVFDSNEHFVIDPVTREIANSLSKKIVVMQYDHNSERFTFEIPKQVDGHSMTACDKVEIHYINIDALDKSLKSTGVYESNDIRISPDDNSVAVFSWLLSRNCTKYAGTLNFLIHFACTTDGVEDYAWNTAIFQSITIGNGMNNGEEVLEPFPDILAQWKAQLFSASETAVLNVTTAEANALAAIEAAGEAKKQAVLDSIPDEYEALSAMADQSHRNKAGAIVLDAEGESIVVNDASEYPLQNLKVFGKSTQDGTPTPDAPVDIVSVEKPVVTVCGKNLLKNEAVENTSAGITFTVNDDGSITANGTSTAVSPLVICKNFLFKAGVTYKLTGCPAGGGTSSWRIDNVGTLFDDGDGGTITYASDTVAQVRVRIAANVKVENLTFYPMIRIASVGDDTYEPYAEQTVETSHTLPGIPVSNGGNYTDANGQAWICDEVDLARGVYIKRITPKTLDNSVPWNEAGTQIDGTYTAFTFFDDIWTNENAIFVSDAFRCYPSSEYRTAALEGIYTNPGISNCNLVIVRVDNARATNFETLSAWLSNNPITVYCQLKEPIETPLSEAEINAFKALHSNRPNTTILNDAGAHMAVSYVADTKTYIDNKIAEMMKGVTE